MSEHLVTSTEVMSTAMAKRATGPPTEQGKRRSRYNAMKYAVFSEVILLPGESRTKYQRLLADFEEYFRPVGLPEQACVEDMVNLVWRRRRLLMAERAEIENMREGTLLPIASGVTFEERLHLIEAKRETQNSDVASESPPPPLPTRQRIRDAPRLLAELRDKIQSRGLDKDKDAASLVEIYGFDPLKSPMGLFEVLEVLSIVSKHPGPLAPEFLNELQSELVNAEIQHFEELERSAKEGERRRAERQKKASRMPPPEKMELLLRYEAGLNREFDRILRRLDGLQRMRSGQPAPPEINVNVST